MVTYRDVLKHLFEEPYTFWWTTLFLAFLIIAFNPEVGLVYLGILVAGWFAYKVYNIKVTINSVSNNTVMALAYAIGAFIAFIGITLLATTYLQGALGIEEIGFSSIWRHLEAGTPIFANNVALTVVVWGFLIPIIETRVLIGYLTVVLSKVFKTPLNLGNPLIWFVFFLVSVVGVIFHFQVRGISDNVALLATFVFWMISCVLITWTKELESATYLHIINNTIVVLRNVGFLTLGMATVGT